MKILMTGFTPRTVGSTKLLYSYMSNTSVIKKGLVKAGHTVDQRTVTLDETTLTNDYDVALIGIAVPQSLSSRFWFSALWAAEQFGPSRTRFFVDDWLLHQFRSQLESGLRNPEKRFYSLPQRHCFEQAKAHTQTWVKWYNFLLKEKYQLLLPCFPWANTKKLLPNLSHIQPVIFDPTPLPFTDPEVLCGSSEPVVLKEQDPDDRDRTWTLAAMRDVGPWIEAQRFDWPVVQYGNKRKGQEVVTERELLDIYTTRWGILGAPYPVVDGCGGWRARYIHAALTRSILFLSPDEGRQAGPPYNLFRSIVEQASTEELAGIADRQRAHLLANTWSLDQLISNLDRYVRGE